MPTYQNAQPPHAAPRIDVSYLVSLKFYIVPTLKASSIKLKFYNE